MVAILGVVFCCCRLSTHLLEGRSSLMERLAGPSQSHGADRVREVWRKKGEGGGRLTGKGGKRKRRESWHEKLTKSLD